MKNKAKHSNKLIHTHIHGTLHSRGRSTAPACQDSLWLQLLHQDLVPPVKKVKENTYKYIYFKDPKNYFKLNT